MIHVVTCVNDSYYYKKMGAWMEGTFLLGSDIKAHLITLDFDIDAESVSKYPHIDFRRVNSKDCPTINSNFCIQEGGWLQCFPECPNTDTFVCIDGDALIQRDFDVVEKKALSNWPDYAIGMNWNAGEGDTLTAEAGRIWPKVPLYTIKTHWYPGTELACHNAGVIVANLKTWKIFYEGYIANLDRVKRYFNHIAHQQWLINWLAQTEPLHVEILPQSFHTHGHYGLYPGVFTTPEGQAVTLVGGKTTPTWVRHKINWSQYSP